LRHNGRPTGTLHAALHRLSICVNSWKMRSRSPRRCRCRFATLNSIASRSGSVRTETRTSPRSVNFSALETKLRMICDTLASSLYIEIRPFGSSKINVTDSPTSNGLSMPRSAPNRCSMSNSVGWTTILPASTLARSRRSLTSSDKPSAALRMNDT
jgi:hypothetical protein